MKTNIDSIIEGQKKVFDLWAETTKSMAETLAGGMPKDSGKDYWNEWLENQKKYWDAIIHSGNLQNAFQGSPDEMRKWAEAQTDFAKKWMEFYNENASKYGFKSPGLSMDNTAMKSWQQWMEQNNPWIQQNITKNLPFTQQWNLHNFKDLYESFTHYWEYLSKMIEFGMTEWDAIGRFVTPDAYREIVGKFMGYKPAKNVDELIKQTNEVFERYIKLFSQYQVNKDWPDQWTKMTQAIMEGHPAASYTTLLEINQNIKNGIDKFYNLAGEGREVEITRILKDIQFTYIAFILRSLELQTKVYEVSQPALSKTLEILSKEYQANKVAPDFQLFFNQYINNLETALLKLMNGSEYAVLQGELSKLAASLKGKMGKVFELTLEGTPFLMKTFSDEVAKEMAALRKRIRDLELRLSKVDHPVAKTKTKSTEKA